MTAPTRACFVDAALKRLRIPTKKRLYFTLHAVLDVKHSECWNREVLRSLVSGDRAVLKQSVKGLSLAYGTVLAASNDIGALRLDAPRSQAA